MNFRLLALALALSIAVFSTGCQKKKPTPDMTRADGTTGESADYINSSEVYGAGAEGLTARDGAFAPGAGNQVRGVLPSVYFDFDQSSIKPSERPKLTQAFEHLQANPGDKLLVEGFCDWRGTAEYNLSLGDRRAVSVKEFVLQLGIDPARVETLSKGDIDAVESADEAQMAKDRRCDLVIVR